MISAALAGGLVDRSLATTLVSAVAISMLAIPALAKLGQRVGSAPRPQAGAAREETPPGDEDGRVIIVGYGRVGALIGDMLDVHKIPFIAVDSDPRLVARARAAGSAWLDEAAILIKPRWLRTLSAMDLRSRDFPASTRISFASSGETTWAGLQTLRLEYYEGFSRFFSGDGRAFRPLTLKKRQALAVQSY